MIINKLDTSFNLERERSDLKRRRELRSLVERAMLVFQ